MKIAIDSLRDTYAQCVRSGSIKEKNIDFELIRSLTVVAEKGLEFINKTIQYIPKHSSDWTFVFRDHYEALRSLIEAYLLFDGIEADNHQCKNAHLCFKHPDLDLDWNFLETIRLKRNAVNYRGHLLTYDEWSLFHIGFDVHIRVLLQEINKKLKENA